MKFKKSLKEKIKVVSFFVPNFLLLAANKTSRSRTIKISSKNAKKNKTQ